MRNSKLTVLGVDPGLGRVGFGVITVGAGQLCLRDYGVIRTPSRSPLPARLCAIHERILDLIDRHRPSRVAVEELYVARNAPTAVAVAQARGVILLAAAERQLDLIELSPASVKLAVTGYGRAEKGQVQRMLQTLFRLRRPPTPDDAADAVAVAIGGCGKGLA